MKFIRARRFGADFPNDFRVQRIGISEAISVADLSPDHLAAFFRENPLIAERLLAESYDKRYQPSTFIMEDGAGYLVGWFSSTGYESQRTFSDLADAATDYLLFSLGKGRWFPPQSDPTGI